MALGLESHFDGPCCSVLLVGAATQVGLKLNPPRKHLEAVDPCRSCTSGSSYPAAPIWIMIIAVLPLPLQIAAEP